MKQKKSRKGTRILFTRTSKGRNVKSYANQKPDQACCGRCAAKLPGIPRQSPCNLRKLTKSKRTVSRAYGGVLCNRCAKEVLKYKARCEDGFETMRDLTIEKYLPVGWYDRLEKKPIISSAATVVPVKDVEALADVSEAVEDVVEAEEKKAKKPKADEGGEGEESEKREGREATLRAGSQNANLAPKKAKKKEAAE